MTGAATVAFLLVGATPAFAKGGVVTAPGGNKLLCFDGTTDGGFGGTCTLPTNGAKGSAILANTSTNPNGDYAGAYVQNTTLAGQALNTVTQLSYSYTGTKTPTPTELSLNVPIDTGGDGTTEWYAFIDAAYCPGIVGSSGVMNVNVITDPNCGIYEDGATFRANWAELVAANPGAKIATDELPFVIAERTPTDVPQTWTVSNVVLGKPGASK